MKNTHFFYLFTLIFLQIPLFSQNQNKSEGEMNYRYYEDSLLGYPYPFRFIPAQKGPETINMDEVIKMIGLPKSVTEIGICPNPTFIILVDEDGCYVKHLDISSRGEYKLGIKHFEQYLPLIRFTPAIQNGKPIKFWLVIPFKIKCQ